MARRRDRAASGPGEDHAVGGGEVALGTKQFAQPRLDSSQVGDAGKHLSGHGMRVMDNREEQVLDAYAVPAHLLCQLSSGIKDVACTGCHGGSHGAKANGVALPCLPLAG
jgi:hypothetical protein